MAGKSGSQVWFYHAPAKKEDKQPVEYPAASQIPLIGGDMPITPDRDDGGMKRGWLRDSDSKYVRLAKMGGRKDLLSIRTPPPKAEGPKPYPRVDWFDHHVEGQAVDTGPRKVYLPDYMVHEVHAPSNDDDSTEKAQLRKPPFSLQDSISAFKRDGDSVTDKMSNLNEELPYSKRFAKKDKRSDVEQMNKALAVRRDSLKQKQKNLMAEPTEPVVFSKLLSMGYQLDWNEQREKYYDQQKKIQNQQPSYKAQAAVNKSKDPVTTEYREEINKTGKQIHTTKATKRFGTLHSKVDSPRTSYQQQLQVEMPQIDI